MNQTSSALTPSLERVKQRSAKIQEICRLADAEVLILDELIAQLEAEHRSSVLHIYRLNKAKYLLNQVPI
jgi:ABC-type dipeptide/oligopeptide/nickel transport system ATPase subunit